MLNKSDKKSNIYDEFRKIEETVNTIFGELWGIPVNRRLLLPDDIITSGTVERYRKPFIDLIERDKDIIASVELPGLEKCDININLTKHTLEISTGTICEEEKKGKDYIYKERMNRYYNRSVSLPFPVDPDRSKASYNNGVLMVIMPKTEIKKKVQVSIE